ILQHFLSSTLVPIPNNFGPAPCDVTNLEASTVFIVFNRFRFFIIESPPASFLFSCVGGSTKPKDGQAERDEPPRSLTNSVAAPPVNRRWIPPSSIKRDAVTNEEKHDIVFRKVRGILNKLTPEKFHKLSDELLTVGLDSPVILKGIFEKALDEPKYSSMYAQLCRKLCEQAPNFEPPDSSVPTFRRLLLKKCQDEFENRSKASEIYDKKDGPLSADEEEQRAIAKHKMLGNIKFVGELGKLDMLHESILHKCIKQLLEKKKRISGLREMAEDLECLCQIMKTVGRSLDTEKAKSLMDQYFARMKSFAANAELQSRIRFMLQDVVELRDKKWIPRKVLSDHGPKTITQIRQDAAKDFGFYIPSNSQNSLGSRNTSGGSMMYRSNAKSRGGMDDVFGSMPLGAANLGTGPGVISTDNFNGYPAVLGRQSRGNLANSGSFIMSSNPTQSQTFAAFQNRQNTSAQPNQNQNQVSTQAKDIPPRFMKKSSFTANPEEISLRPMQNSMMQLKSKVPSSLPKSAVSSSQTNLSIYNNGVQELTSSQSSTMLQSGTLNQRAQQLTNSMLQKDPPILIKQPNQDKNKSNKKDQGVTKSEAIRNIEVALESLVSNTGNIDEIISTLREYKIPKKFNSELVTHLVNITLDKTDSEREFASQLIAAMRKDGQLTAANLLDTLKMLFQQLTTREAEIPRVKSHVSGFAARGIVDEVVTLAEVADPLYAGQHYPLFFLCLQHLHKLQGKQWLGRVYHESKVNLVTMLPEADQTKDRLLEILEDRGLSFLFPLLRIQADLAKQIQLDPTPGVFYKWIKDNIDQSQHTVPGLVRYITAETTLIEGVDIGLIPDKTVQEKERDFLEKYKPVFQALLQDHINLQAVALYALQVHCYNNNFPKGMLLRWFVLLYDMEIIEEEAFIKWKEDITEDYPGKGKALFQVNQWLTWLEEAEEEEEASDDGDN
uniref:Eukaryotic translation initiation factor 4 gamma 2 n=1 Tax=Strigamia maritima TaxID=126957 RepID=T1IXX2_STRMM